MSLSKTLSRTLAKLTHTDWATLFLLYTTHTFCEVFSKSTERVKAIVFSASLLRLADAILCPHDLCRYCQSDLELSDTSFPLANTDSQPHNLSTHPSTQHPCHPARTPSKTLTKEVFLIRTFFPVSNSPLPLNTPLPCFRLLACLITFCRLEQTEMLEGWKRWEGNGWGRWWEGARGGGNRGLLRVRDVGRCYRECEDRGQQDPDHSYSITTRPLHINPPAFVIISPLLLLCFSSPSVYTKALGQSLNLKHTEQNLEEQHDLSRTQQQIHKKCSETQ